jgi:hypothetical protein
MLAKDVVEEISRRYEDYGQLDKSDKKLINSGINRACGLVLRNIK